METARCCLAAQSIRALLSGTRRSHCAASCLRNRSLASRRRARPFQLVPVEDSGIFRITTLVWSSNLCEMKVCVDFIRMCFMCFMCFLCFLCFCVFCASVYICVSSIRHPLTEKLNENVQNYIRKITYDYQYHVIR